ncbi:MAG: UDP-N-acetylmuramoylalanyl-D-glutamate--2,6-diaminopimelate ligase, partial [Wolbachia sp.]
AIKRGINIANDESIILLVAGKGHERFQMIEDQVLEFSDVEVMRESKK